MRRGLATSALIVAWLFANGAIWDVVQVFAWGRMFTNYAQTMTVGAALRATFDPTRSCEICGTVAMAKETADAKSAPLSKLEAAKLLMVVPSVEVPVFGGDRGEWRIARTEPHSDRADPVPVPPPRRLALLA